MKKKNHFFILAIISLIGFVCKSTSEKKIVRKKIGDYFIGAAFIDETQIDGIARYYDGNNKLLSTAEYKNGIKYGPAINFYESGMKRDSVFYRDGLPNGKAFSYDSLGNKKGMSSYYYGVVVGDNILYSNGKPREYFFTDFHSTNLFSCYYDSAGRYRMGKSTLAATTNLTAGDSGEVKLNVFFYLPQPPNLTTTFSLGLMDAKNTKRNESLIRINNRFFIDTILSQPEKGYKYYISTHIQNIKDSINKVIINELTW